MKLVNYLDQLGSLGDITPDAKKQKRMPLAERIVERLTPSHLRLQALDASTREMLSQKVGLSIKNNAPITLILAVGGFKGARLPSSPHLNWAEVFHVDFLVKTLGEIALIYPPGLRLEFSGDDVIVPLMNNYKLEWTTTYNLEFDKLLEIFSQNLPANIVLTNRPASSFYDRLTLEDEVKIEADKLELDPEVLRLKLKHAQNNFVFDGEQNLTTLSTTDKQSKLERSVVIHDAWLAVDYTHRREYLEGDNHIPIIHKKGMQGCYGIRSTKSSDVQFWEAFGVVEEREGKFIPKLLSANSPIKNQKSLKAHTRFAALPGLRDISIV